MTLTVTDDDGLNTADSTIAIIGLDALPPLADAGGPYHGRVDVDVSFNGTGSKDLDGSIVAYEWNFGDDSSPGSGPTPSHD